MMLHAPAVVAEHPQVVPFMKKLVAWLSAGIAKHRFMHSSGDVETASSPPN